MPDEHHWAISYRKESPARGAGLSEWGPLKGRPIDLSLLRSGSLGVLIDLALGKFRKGQVRLLFLREGSL